jgi:hypothetical protein
MLRSIDDMRGFTIRASDGEIGSVDDFLFDDERWAIRYLVANTGGWLTGRLVLVSPIAFRSVDWDGRRFEVDLTRRQIEDSPSIDADQPVSRWKEEEYFRYYGYPTTGARRRCRAARCTRACPSCRPCRPPRPTRRPSARARADPSATRISAAPAR